MVKNESIMQRLKKGTAEGKFWIQKKLKKRHRNECIWVHTLVQNSLKIG